MSTNLRRLALALFALLVVSYAWQSLLRAELFGRDWRVLSALASSAHGSASWFGASSDIDADGGHPLGVASLALSLRLWGHSGDLPRAMLIPARLENLALIVATAIASALAVRRFFVPWTGSEQASAAGWSAGILFAVHPLLYPLGASLAARGDLLALAFSAIAAALFLKGRQDYGYGFQAVAAGFAVLAGLSSDLAFALPVAVAFAEFVSARRYRPHRVRWRTTITTFAVFGACVATSVLARVLIDDRVAAPSFVIALVESVRAGRWLALTTNALEKIGLVVLPINAATLGYFGQAIAAALVLIAIQPGLLAARTAPRLWSFLLAVLSTFFVLALFLRPNESTSSRDVTHADALCIAILVASAGLGVAATALSGTRRWLTPLAVAVGSAFLAHANAASWVRASIALESLSIDLAAARTRWGRDANLFVLDPPSTTLGVDVVEDSLPHLVDRELEGARDSSKGVVRGVERRAFAVFVRSKEFRELARAPIVVLEPDPDASTSEDGGAFASFERRGSTELALGADSKGSRTWYGDGRSTLLDLAPIENLALRVRAKSDSDTSKPPRVGWRRTDDDRRDEDPSNVQVGVWIRQSPEPEALFDFSTSTAWLASKRVSRLWSVQGWPLVDVAEVLADVPELAPPELASADASPKDAARPITARVDGDDWVFELAPAPLGADEKKRARFDLVLVSLEDLRSATIACDVDAKGIVRAPRAARAARSLERPLWSLELSLDGVTVGRTGGRVELAH